MNEKKLRELQQGINKGLPPELPPTGGLGLTESQPPKAALEPQIMKSPNPCLFADWFQISGATGGNMCILFGKQSYEQGIYHEVITVAIPNEIAADLKKKLEIAYPEKKP